MAAVQPLRSSPRANRRTPLRLVPPRHRRRTRAYGDVLFATTLSTLLAVGIVAVLLLNTAMQTQADRIAIMQHRLASLALQVQAAQVGLDRDNAPSALASRAGAVGMVPAARMPVIRAAARPPARLPAPAKLSARARAARTTRGG